MGYDGFISYSHAADGRLAPALQAGLQRLAKPWNSRRSLRIFRDETGLATNPHLWAAIEGALDESEWFVLLASPEAAASEWVNREIAHWLSTKTVDRVLPVVTDGMWQWDPQAGDFTADSSAVPDALRGALTAEPRHLDMRWARAEADLDLRNSRFRSTVADLAAPMHGIAKDELEGEDIHQHRRALRLARFGVGALVVLVVLSVVVSTFAVRQRDRARTATAEAVVQRNLANANADTADHELLVSESQGLLASNRQLATLLAIEADRHRSGADTRDALMNAVLAEPRLQRTFAGPAADIAPLAGQRVVIVSADRGQAPNRNVLQVWNSATGNREPWRDAPSGDTDLGPIDVASTADGGSFVVLSRDGTVQMYSGRTLRPQGPPFATGFGARETASATVRINPAGTSIAVSRDGTPAGSLAGPSVRVFSRETGRWMSDARLAGDNGRVAAMAFDATASVIAFVSPTRTGSTVVVDEMPSGRSLVTFDAVAANSVAVDWGHHRVVLALPAGGGSDAIAYTLDGPTPTMQAINVGPQTALGLGVIGYDSTNSRLGISTTNGFGIFNAATLTSVDPASVLPTNTVPGAFAFVGADRVLTSTISGGPVEAWNLRGTSVLVTRTLAQYAKVVPYSPTGIPRQYLAVSIRFTERSITILGPDFRPLGAPIVVEHDLQAQPGEVRNAIKTIGPLFCVDPRTGRMILDSLTTGDVTIRDGAPPFRVLSSAPQAAVGLPDPDLCEWSPDGRQVAIGTAPIAGNTGPSAVGLYDVASEHLRIIDVPAAQVISSVAYSADSKSLWVNGIRNCYRITNLETTPRTTLAFPGASGISPDERNQHLVVTSQDSVRVYDARTLKPLTEAIPLGGSFVYNVDAASDAHDAVINSSQGWRLVDLHAQQPVGPWIPSPFPTVLVHRR